MGINIQYLYPFWGSNNLSPEVFLAKVTENGFNGIEIDLPEEKVFLEALRHQLEKIRAVDPAFQFMAQQVLNPRKESPNEYLDRATYRLSALSALEPDAINSHTGKDHFDFDENCRIIEAIENFSVNKGIPIYHEIHRGRFSFHSRTILKYLQKFPELKLVGDFSHWCLVSESLMEDQEETLEQVYPHVEHIHARIGTEQASQVNSPYAPEWETHLDRFLYFWQKMIQSAIERGKSNITITPEFGPFPYMPQAPFTKQPFYNQHEMNVSIKQLIEKRIILNTE